MSPSFFRLSFLVFTSVLGMTTFFSQAKAEAPKYPRIEVIKGEVEFESRDVKSKASKGMVLREKSKFKVGLKAELELDLDQHRKLLVLPGSEIVIPSVSWETGEAPLLVLNAGRIRWLQKEKADYNIALSSPLFGFLAPPGDYVLSFDPSLAKCELWVISGRLEFSAMNADESVMVESQHKASFQGVLEGNEIAYDILLKGKKVPRGQLSKVSAMTEEDRSQFSEKQLEQRRVEIKKMEAAERAKKLPKPGEICKEPFAKLNDCVWTCEGAAKSDKSCKVGEAGGAKCFRARCNANGDWVDRSELSGIAAKKCTLKPLVGLCDY